MTSAASTDPVRFGVMAYNYTATEMIEIARTAETLGFDGFWVGEHLLWPVGYGGFHPTRDAVTEIVDPIIGPLTELPDPWAVFGAVAVATSRIRIGSAVYIATARHPLASARSAASVADLSEGRLLLGVGAGWVREEFEALGLPFDGRGAVFDEWLDVFRAALHGGPFEHAGEHWSFPSIQVVPRAVHVPLIIGGNIPRAYRRAARHGDGWINSGYATLDTLSRSRDAIAAELARAGRSNDPFQFWVRPERFEPEESQRFAQAGFHDQIFPADDMWPRGPQSFDEKRAQMREWACRFGVATGSTDPVDPPSDID